MTIPADAAAKRQFVRGVMSVYLSGSIANAQ